MIHKIIRANIADEIVEKIVEKMKELVRVEEELGFMESVEDRALVKIVSELPSNFSQGVTLLTKVKRESAILAGVGSSQVSNSLTTHS